MMKAPTAEAFELGLMVLEYMVNHGDTAEQRADIFTKALGAADYTRNKAWLVH